MAKKWIQHAAEKMKKKGTEGSFTRWAKEHHMGTKQAADTVMAHKDKYSPSIVKKANFAKNVAK